VPRFVPTRPPSEDKVVVRRQEIFEAWIDECAMWGEACIEGALNVFPSLQVSIGKDGSAPR
jgi:hypothetical protein